LVLSIALFNKHSSCIPDEHRGRAASIEGNILDILSTNFKSSVHTKKCTCNHDQMHRMR
jgi:hypothetical protein